MCMRYPVFFLREFPPSKWPKSSPFVVEGRTRTVHVRTTWRRANRGSMSEPCGLFLWRRGRRRGPSLEHWGGVLVPSDPVRRERPGTALEWVRQWSCKPLWMDCARGRGLVGAEAAPQWGVSVGTNPEIAETLVHSAEAPSGRLIWCAGSKVVMTQAKLSVRCYFRGGDRGTQSSVGADHGHSVIT